MASAKSVTVSSCGYGAAQHDAAKENDCGTPPQHASQSPEVLAVEGLVSPQGLPTSGAASVASGSSSDPVWDSARGLNSYRLRSHGYRSGSAAYAVHCAADLPRCCEAR